MARLKGSVSSKEAKTISKEIEQIQGSSYRYNFDFLRLVELLLSYKIAEAACEYPKDRNERGSHYHTGLDPLLYALAYSVGA